jgi:hypothetical protein
MSSTEHCHANVYSVGKSYSSAFDCSVFRFVCYVFIFCCVVVYKYIIIYNMSLNKSLLLQLYYCRAVFKIETIIFFYHHRPESFFFKRCRFFNGIPLSVSYNPACSF